MTRAVANVTGEIAKRLDGFDVLDQKGLDHALSAYGRLGRASVMAPAIALARDGFVLGEADAAIIEEKATRLAADPAAAWAGESAPADPAWEAEEPT